MNIWKLIFRNLVFYRRTHLWTVLGMALATAILVGALIVGDSVRYSLQQMVSDRLGNTDYSLEMGDRYFRIQLADNLNEILGAEVAALLQTKGIAILTGGSSKAHHTQVIGVDKHFENIGSTPSSYYDMENNEVIINQQLASQLDLKPGDEFLLRLLKIDYLSKDAPFSGDSDLSIVKRVRVKAIATVLEFGHFNLKSNQIVPNTVFMSLLNLSKMMDIKNKANTLLIADRTNDPVQMSQLESAMEEAWSLNDIGLYFDTLKTHNQIELKSERIFLEENITQAVYKTGTHPLPVFTYFVNELRAGHKMTPYSFVAAPGSPIVSRQMPDDEIIINSWLANDLDVKKGDSLTLIYFIIGPRRQLVEKESTFRINSVVPLSGIFADEKLMPDFPGLGDAENCRDWDPGIPIDLEKIRSEDEKYWDAHKGTPKAYITLNAAQQMWQNRFGNLTAIRFGQENVEEIEQKIREVLNPADFGFTFQPVRKKGIRASKESVDFAELFLGLSFFVIIAALLLTALLFVLTAEQRKQETGLYMALGFPKKMIRCIMLYESGLLALISVIAGSILGVLYNQVVLIALKTIWKGAVGTSALRMHIDLSTVLVGTIAGFVIMFLTIVLIVRNYTHRSIIGLQADQGKTKISDLKRRSRLGFITGIISLLIAIILIVITGPGRGKEAAASFFGAGFLLLVSGIAFTNYYFYRISRNLTTSRLNLVKVGIRNVSRQRTRSLMLVGLLASGLFIVFTVGANRHGAIQNSYQRSSGTGGFALFAESTIPVLYDLNSARGKEFYGLDDIVLEPVRFASFRVKEGDDASCLNLNRVANPQLLGLNPVDLESRGAFTFTSMTDEVDGGKPWLVLDQDFGKDVIPGIADETVIIWGLGKSVGDTLEYMDENGKKYQIKLVAGLANSIFQGNIIISENILIEKYPSVSGYRLFLIDSPEAETDTASQIIAWALQDLGMTISSTSERLDAFNQVENTYLSIFLILGGFGLMLGTIGLGIVVVRNIMERRGELALLKAVGFKKGKLQSLILSEHIFLLLIGAGCGFFAALFAVFPAMIAPGTAIPYFTIIITFVLIIMSGLIWTYLATSLATRGNLIPALRNE